MPEHSSSLVSLLVQHARQRPDAIALRHKQFGLWQQWSWAKLLQLSEHYATALHSYGFQKDQSLLIASSPSADVVAMSLAVQALGGKVQLIDQPHDDLDAQSLLSYLAILQPEYVLLQQREQWSTLESVHYHPTYIFYIERNQVNRSDPEYLVDIGSLLSEVKSKHHVISQQLQIPQQQIAFSFERVEAAQRLRVYYSHQELIAEAKRLVEEHQLDAEEDAFIARAFSSVGHIRYLWSAWLLAGFSLNIPESLNMRDQDRQVISPTLVLGTKSTYQRVEQLLQRRLPQTPHWLARHYQHALQRMQRQQQLNIAQKILLALFRQVILEELGFARLKTALIVGVAVDRQTQLFYQHLGVQLQYWGQHTEWQRTALAKQTDPLNSLSISTSQ